MARKFITRLLLWDNAGFWGWDANGLHCFFKGRFVSYPLPHWLSGSSLWGAAIDQNGAVWLETSDGSWPVSHRRKQVY